MKKIIDYALTLRDLTDRNYTIGFGKLPLGGVFQWLAPCVIFSEKSTSRSAIRLKEAYHWSAISKTVYSRNQHQNPEQNLPGIVDSFIRKGQILLIGAAQANNLYPLHLQQINIKVGDYNCQLVILDDLKYWKSLPGRNLPYQISYQIDCEELFFNINLEHKLYKLQFLRNQKLQLLTYS